MTALEKMRQICPDFNVKSVGKVVAEWDEEDQVYLIMFPDGKIESARNRAWAQRKISVWSKERVKGSKGTMGVTFVEWRT